MRKIKFHILTLITTLLCTSALLEAQNLIHSKVISGISTDRITAMKTDASNNLYVGGYFIGTVDFDPGLGTNNLTSNGATDGFVAKYDAAGALLWATKMGGAATDRVSCIDVNATSGVVIAGGYFQNTITLGSNSYTSLGFNDAFACFLDGTNGSIPQASIVLAGSGQDVTTGVAYQGNYYAVTGSFSGIGVVGLNTVTSNGGTDVFLISNRLGSQLTSFGGTSDDYSRNVIIDGNNNVITCGGFQGTIDINLNAGITNRTAVNGIDAYVLCYGNLGNLIWGHTLGGMGLDQALNLTSYSNNDIGVVGLYTDIINGIVATNLPSGTLTNAGVGQGDAFVLKIAANGTIARANKFGGAGNERALDITCNGSDETFIAGTFNNTTNFDVSVANQVAVGVNDGFLAKFDAAGNYLWANVIASNTANDAISDIYCATTSTGECHVGLSFIGTVKPDAISSINGSPSSYDIGLLKYGTMPIVMPTPNIDLIKRISNIRPASGGNQIVTFELRVTNTGATDYDNLNIVDAFSPNMTSAVMSVSGIRTTFNLNPIGLNAAWNGTSQTQLMNLAVNNRLRAGELIVIEYEVTIDRGLLSNLVSYDNTATASTSTIGGNVTTTLDLNLPNSLTATTNPVVEIHDGLSEVKYSLWLQDNGGIQAVAHPLCGKITWGSLRAQTEFEQKCGYTGVHHDIFIGEDECGNQYRALGRFTIVDTQAPSFITQPNDKIVDCNAGDANEEINKWLAAAGGASYADGGTNPLPILTNDYASTTCTPGNYVVKFTVTDACGLKTSATANLVVTSTTTTTSTISVVKLATTLQNKTVECKQNYNFDEPITETTCDKGIASMSYADEKIDGFCNNEFIMKRTWTIKDACGTEMKTSQIIEVNDNSVPIFNTLPSALTMRKGIFKAWQKLFFTHMVKATDVCSAVKVAKPTVTYLSDKQAEYNLIATDECGNATSHTIVINFEDGVLNINKNMAEKSIKPIEKSNDMFIDEDIATANLIYPNPTSRIVNIVLQKNLGAAQKVHIYRMDGRVALNMDIEGQQGQVVSIDISNFDNANYIVEVQYANQSTFHKVQKIN